MSIESDQERRSGLPEFEVGGVVFDAWVQGNGGGARYVWRSRCRRAACGGIVTGPHPVQQNGETVMRMRVDGWARVDGEVIGRGFVDIRSAMVAASAAVASSARTAA